MTKTHFYPAVTRNFRLQIFRLACLLTYLLTYLHIYLFTYLIDCYSQLSIE